jgi:hypothetical protein
MKQVVRAERRAGSGKVTVARARTEMCRKLTHDNAAALYGLG